MEEEKLVIAMCGHKRRNEVYVCVTNTKPEEYTIGTEIKSK